MILLNFGSILLGLMAWILPIVNLAIANKAKHKNWAAFSIASLSACAIAVCMQLYNIVHMVNAEAWGSLMDTSNAMANVSLVLIVITITLNVITLIIYRKNSEK
ncbi:MAG: hypothetical protein LBE76_02215 [Nitrososphaerota archaeon]|nr:hypothetical protein [Nitrososphaerota archaeon]